MWSPFAHLRYTYYYESDKTAIIFNLLFQFHCIFVHAPDLNKAQNMQKIPAKAFALNLSYRRFPNQFLEALPTTFQSINQSNFRLLRRTYFSLSSRKQFICKHS